MRSMQCNVEFGYQFSIRSDFRLVLSITLQHGPHREHSGTTKNKAIAKELANRSAYQIQYVNAVTVIIVFKV
jgi:hypothetical protein